MLFNSYEFLLLFLPAVVAAYFALARLSAFAANAFLAGASVFFYAWWRLDFVWILLASVVVARSEGYELVTVVAPDFSTEAVIEAAGRSGQVENGM